MPFISDLDETAPLGTGSITLGDDYIREIKANLKDTFPNIAGEVTPTQDELNYVDGVTSAIQTQLDARAALASSNTFTGAQMELEHLTPSLLFDETDAATNERQWRIRCSGGQFNIHPYDDASAAGTAAVKIDRSGTTVTEIELNATAVDLNGNLDVSGTALVTGTSTFTAAATFNATMSGTGGSIILASVAPGIALSESGAAADQGLWRMFVDASVFNLQTRTDAGGAQTTPLAITRSAGVITEIEMNATTFDLNGNVDISGTVTTPNTSAQEVGTKGPQTRGISANDSTAASDQGNSITYTGTGGHTLTLDSDPPTNAMVIIVNEGSGALTIAASGSLIFAGATGSRTLAPGCMAAAYHRQGSGIWQIAGQLS